VTHTSCVFAIKRVFGQDPFLADQPRHFNQKSREIEEKILQRGEPQQKAEMRKGVTGIHGVADKSVGTSRFDPAICRYEAVAAPENDFC